MLQPKIVETKDGSSTLYSEETGDYYHSLHGAETESTYVFIDKGLALCSSRFEHIKILEVGMGTGLNLSLSYSWFLRHLNFHIDYVALEPFPLDEETVLKLKYNFLDEKGMDDVFRHIHTSEWNKKVQLNPSFSLLKSTEKLQDASFGETFNLVYYDAFGPTYQQEMWEMETVEKMASLIQSGGILVTYCAQGQFRRNLQSCGFEVERLDGPPGKREMIRAVKL